MKAFTPKRVLYHDYGGTPENRDGVFNPYHVLVFPDGTVRYRYPGDPYGQAAPHAYHQNDEAIGLSYAGPVGSTPTPEAMRALQGEREKINARFPGLPGLGHGEAFHAHMRGHPFARPSKAGRDLSEASWRDRADDLNRVPEAGLAPLSLLSDQPQVAPSTPSAPRVASAPMSQSRMSLGADTLSATAPPAPKSTFDARAFWDDLDRSRHADGGAVKSSKVVAQYRDRPKGAEQCGSCSMFKPPNACTAVAGEIAPEGWCTYWKASAAVGDIAKAIKAAERQVDRNPTEAQKESGNYAKGHLTVHGLPITIENPKGAQRSGMGKDGKRWSVTMPAAYGYVKGSEGADKDHVDVYLGPDHNSTQVFVVDQVNAETSAFDEHKALLFYASKDAALADYRKAFSDGKGDERIGGVTSMTITEFRDWVKNGNTKKPLAKGNGFANGGKVDMPLLGGKKNVGRNIAMLQDEGKKRDQALAIALDVARRSSRKKRAAGGPVAMDPTEQLARDLLGPGPLSTYLSMLALSKGPPPIPGPAAEGEPQGLADGGRTGDFARPLPEDRTGQFARDQIDKGPFGRYADSQGLNAVFDDWRRTRKPDIFDYLLPILRLSPDKFGEVKRPDGVSVMDPPGYADGGAPNDVIPAYEPVRSPVPEWLLGQQEEAKAAEEPLHGARFPSGVFEPFELPAEMTGIPSLARASDAYHKGEMGEAAANAAFVAAPAIRPAARLVGKGISAMKPWMLPATAGGVAATVVPSEAGPPAQAEAPKPVDPVIALQESLKQMQTQRATLQEKQQNAQKRMDAMRPKRGEINKKDHPQYFAAKEEYEQTRDDLNALKTDIGGAEQSIKDALAEKKQTEGDARYKDVTQNRSHWDTFVQDFAPWLGLPVGLATGYLGGKGMGAVTRKLDSMGANKADKMLSGKLDSKAWNERIGNLNKFWSEGSKPGAMSRFMSGDKGRFGVPPFSHAGKAPFWKGNQKGVTPSHELYPPRSRAGDYALNSVITGGFAGEAALGWNWLKKAEEAEAAANAALKTDKSEVNIQRLEQAKKDKALAEFMVRMGAVGAIGQGGKGTKEIYSSPGVRPNIARADSERANISEWIAKGKAKAAKPKSKPPEGQGPSPKKPSARRNRNGAAPLLPLAALPQADMLEDPVEETSLPTALSSYSDVDETAPFAKGGSVKKHHSAYQPRRVGKFAGGPVYPKMGPYPAFAKADGGEVKGEERMTNYVPNPVHDYFAKGYVDQQQELWKDAALGAFNVLNGMWLRQPPTSRFMRGAGNLSLANGFGTYGLLGAMDYGKLRQAGRGMEMWRNTGLPGSPPPTPREAEPVRTLAPESDKNRSQREWWDRIKGDIKSGKPVSETPPWAQKAFGGPVGDPSGGQQQPLVGPVMGSTPGRADALDVDVASGSYVVPADTVAALGGNNTGAGMEKLQAMFGAPDPQAVASGGRVPIRISDGEFVVSPDQVAKIGGGDMQQGHRILDALVKKVRREHIAQLKSLPGPAQD